MNTCVYLVPGMKGVRILYVLDEDSPLRISLSRRVIVVPPELEDHLSHLGFDNAIMLPPDNYPHMEHVDPQVGFKKDKEPTIFGDNSQPWKVKKPFWKQ